MVSPGVSTASNTSQATRPGAVGASPSQVATSSGPACSGLRSPRVDQADHGRCTDLGLVQPLLVQGLAFGQARIVA